MGTLVSALTEGAILGVSFTLLKVGAEHVFAEDIAKAKAKGHPIDFGRGNWAQAVNPLSLWRRVRGKEMTPAHRW